MLTPLIVDMQDLIHKCHYLLSLMIVIHQLLGVMNVALLYIILLQFLQDTICSYLCICTESDEKNCLLCLKYCYKN